MIGVLDLGIGNIENVRRAVDGIIVKDSYGIERTEKLIFPGVGNFGEIAERVKELKPSLLDFIGDGKPFLGICLGLHYLFKGSEEQPEARGLNVFPGKVVAFGKKGIPHIGWNQIFIRKEHPLLQGIENGSYFYFVHSYYVKEVPDDYILAETEHLTENIATRFPSAVAMDSIYGVQFHPEKSGKVGLRLLKNFRRL